MYSGLSAASSAQRRLEQNLGAADVTLTEAQLARLTAVRAPLGDRYADMSPLNG